MNIKQVDRLPEEHINIIRVYYEGQSKQNEDICVCQVMVHRPKKNMMGHTYLRLVGDRNLFKVRSRIIFGRKNTYVMNHGFPIKITQAGPAFTQYDCPGKIIRGG